MAEYEFVPKEFSTIAVNGNDLNMWMIKPPNFDAFNGVSTFCGSIFRSGFTGCW